MNASVSASVKRLCTFKQHAAPTSHILRENLTI
ncbi:hypothetical protein F441_14555 [Phytophthora nicotianae CJ01A1]|nr:hypothetical protein F441_14555 [Phytophthora nicotianae CJ01A1]